MKTNSRSLESKLLFTLMGIVFGTFVTVLIIFISIDLRLEKSELLSLIASTLTLVVAVTAILFTILSIRVQKQQWLNDSFIKYESSVLLEFREAFGKAEQSLYFFQHELLSTKNYAKEYGLVPKEPPVLKRDRVVENFNIIVDLNNLYNANQHIFRKHGLEKQISCITLFLEAAQSLPNKDLIYVQTNEDELISTYSVECWGQIIYSFNSMAVHLFDYAERNIQPDIDEMNAFLAKDQKREFERFMGILEKRIFNLKFMLDELTMHTEVGINANLSFREYRYYQPLQSK